MFFGQTNSFFPKVLECSIYIFFFVFPFLNIRTFLYSGTSFRSMALVLFTIVLGLLFGFVFFSKKRSITIANSPILIALFVYGAFLFISAYFGFNFHTSFWSVATRMTGIWYFLHLAILMLLVWGVFYERKKQKKLILTILISTGLYSLLSFLGPEGLGWFFNSYPMDGFTFGNSTFAAMYLFGAFILSLYYFYIAEIKKWWMYILPPLLLINPNILNSKIWFGDFSSGFVGEARASAYVILLSIFTIIVFWIISKIKSFQTKKYIIYSIFILSLVTFVFSAFSLLSEDGFLRRVYLDQATGARPLVWEMSVGIIKEKPFLGWGPDNFERIFETHYDNRLLQDEYGNEAWFDRAHNVFVDQAVDNGLVGLTLYFLVYLVIISCLIYSIIKSSVKEDRVLATFLLVYFSLHILELQTAFDTSISYPMLALMAVLAGIVFHRTVTESGKSNFEFLIDDKLKYALTTLLGVFLIWSFVWGAYPLIRTQVANGEIRTIGFADKRIPFYDDLFYSDIDKHAFLWRISTDFQRGIGDNPSILEDSKKVEYLKQEILIFENEYRQYLKDNPKHFRAHLNLADILIYQSLFGVNKLAEAQGVLDDAILLVPQSPQPYWMKAVAYIYMREFDLARKSAKDGLALNPKIKQSQSIVDYVERSIKTFPEIDLYFFRQI